MKKIFDFYLVLIICINIILALTVVCAPYSSMLAIEALLANPEELNSPANLSPPDAIKQIQIVGNATGTIEFNR